MSTLQGLRHSPRCFRRSVTPTSSRQSSHNLSKNHMKTSPADVLGIRTSTSKMPNAKNHWINLTSLNKMVGNLYVDFSKQIQSEYSKLLKMTAANVEPKQQKVTVQQKPVKKSKLEKQKEKAEEEAERLKLIARLHLKAHHMVDREQHEFGEAMISAYESSKDGESKEGEVKTVEAVKAAKVPSRGENLVKSISRVLPSRDKPKTESIVQKEEAQKKVIMKRETLEQGSANRKTKGLVMALRASTSNISRLRRLEEFCKHMAEYPSTRGKAVKVRAIPCLLKLRQSPDQAIQELSMEALSLVGYVDPVKGRGIRLLCLDGGGTRGLITIEILKHLQESCGQEIHKMFDYVCGVSTGSLLAVMLSAFRVPLPETELLYKQYSAQMFSRNKLMGVGKLFMSHSYYESEVWEKVLHESIGFKTFLESTRDPECPKIGLVSSLMNVTHLQNYFFRNYTLPSGVYSHFPGSCQYALWQGIRASSAAPGYFEEMKLGDWIHQDGGVITNNPTAIALHECRLLWPNERIQCVVSVGTGKYVPRLEAQPADSASLKTKLTKIVQSATDTEAVHTTLQDLLPPSSYFRLNPYMSQDFQLDEIRKEQWDNMQRDTQMYCRKNSQKIEKAAETLLKARLPHQKAQDWLQQQRDML